MKKSKAIELLAKGEIQIYVDVFKPKLLKSILKQAFPSDDYLDYYFEKSFKEIIIKKPIIHRGLQKNHLWFYIFTKLKNIKTVNLSEIKTEKQTAPITATEMAKKLIDGFRVVLMSEDTECGNEILCTEIAKKHAKIVAYNMIKESELTKNKLRAIYWELVIKKIDEYVS